MCAILFCFTRWPLDVELLVRGVDGLALTFRVSVPVCIALPHHVYYLHPLTMYS